MGDRTTGTVAWVNWKQETAKSTTIVVELEIKSKYYVGESNTRAYTHSIMTIMWTTCDIT